MERAGWYIGRLRCALNDVEQGVILCRNGNQLIEPML
jgi:hypothetical protein